MLLGLEHVGMTVGNVDRSLSFYVNLLGLRPGVRRRGRNGDVVAFLGSGVSARKTEGGLSRREDF